MSPDSSQSAAESAGSGPPPDRREFFKKVLAGGIGGVLMAPPLAAGVAVLCDPLRRAGVAGQWVRVTSLKALPEDGLPVKFPVIGRRVDAWTQSAAKVIGAVYLRRLADRKVEAFNVVCPHLGCFVDFVPNFRGKPRFVCPCHDSTFALNGAIDDPTSPARRGLDTLAVDLRDGEVWVQFENFRAGVSEKIPV